MAWYITLFKLHGPFIGQISRGLQLHSFFYTVIIIIIIYLILKIFSYIFIMAINYLKNIFRARVA